MAAATSRHRLRFAVGLLCGALVGIGASYYLLARSRSDEVKSRQERAAIVTLRALTDVVQKTGGAGDGVRLAVAAWRDADPSLKIIRVLAFDGISLEASTAPEDTGANAAPRRLSHDEKPIYDRGQRLRAAIETNRDEGVSRKEEIEIETLPDGTFSLAAPVEQDGSVIGMVEIATKIEVAAPRPSLLIALLCALLPVIVFAGFAVFVGERRLPLTIIAAVLILASVGLYGLFAVRTLAADSRTSATAVAQMVKAQADRATSLLGSLSLPAAFDAASWDADQFRRPRGLISAAGDVDEAKLAARNQDVAGAVRNAVIILALVGLAIVLLFGLGAMAHLATTLRVHRLAYTYTLPAMVGMILLVFFPFIYGVALSFTDATIYTMGKSIAETWVGIQNYVQILGDFKVATHAEDGSLAFNYKNFYWTFYITVMWTVLNVAIGVTVGLILALILNTKGLKLRPAYRVLLILPWAVPNYITALIWRGMFHRQFGVFNMIILMFGGDPISWFDKPFTSFLTALATNGWLSFPFMMVVSLGALQSIPGELYEAARVDGASRWQQFISITLPSLKPALIPAIILSVVWTFNMFNIPYLVTAGQPAYSTEILITGAYKFAFEQYQYGYAAAYSTIIFGILLIYGSIQNRITRATEGI